MSRYHCGNCDYEGPAYGTAHSGGLGHMAGMSAPWCPKCGMNHKLEPLLRWRTKQETLRRRRGMQLFIVSVITAALCLFALYFAVAILGVEEAKGDELPEAPRYMNLPPAPDCWHLYNKEGKHEKWAACMGVGYE